MTTARDTGRLIAAFTVGFLGWLAITGIRPVDPWIWLAPFALGLIAGLVAPRPLGLVVLLLGIGLSYPAAIGLGLIAYLGENWTTYLTGFLSAASVGFGLILLAAGATSGTKARSG